LPEKKAVEVPSSALDPKDLLTPKELASRLKVKKGWVYEKMRPGQANPMPVIKMGKYLRFNWPDVSAWLRSLERASRKRAA